MDIRRKDVIELLGSVEKMMALESEMLQEALDKEDRCAETGRSMARPCVESKSWLDCFRYYGTTGFVIVSLYYNVPLADKTETTKMIVRKLCYVTKRVIP